MALVNNGYNAAFKAFTDLARQCVAAIDADGTEKSRQDSFRSDGGRMAALGLGFAKGELPS